MPASALPRLLRRAREHPLLALAAFAVAAAAQFWATQVLVSGDLPDRLAAGEGEELVLSGLGTDPRLLSLEERGGLDVRFDRARLAPATAALLQQLGIAAPAGEGPLAWIGGAGEEAPSILEVAPAEEGGARQLVLRTLPSLAGGVARVELEADAPLTVSLATALVPGQATAPRRLFLGQTELKVDGALPLQVMVPAGSPLRLALSLGGPEAVASLTPGSLREGREGESGLALASLGLRRGNGLYASFACAAAPGAWLWLGSASLARGDCAGAAALRLVAVELKPGEVAARLAGSGWLWADGRPASAHLLARLTANSALAALLLVADGVLAAWLALALLNLRRRGRYRVFISYRRGDSAGHAGRLTRCLEESLGQDAVFFDVDDIAPGTPFGPAIIGRIHAAEVVLAVISQYWLTASDEKTGKRRLDDSGDWVRRELETALTQGKRVIPVLVGGVRMPTEADLPTSLNALAGLHAVLIEEANFERDVETLAEALDHPPPAPDAQPSVGV
jgi:TIR domain-containing protein